MVLHFFSLPISLVVPWIQCFVIRGRFSQLTAESSYILHHMLCFCRLIIQVCLLNSFLLLVCLVLHAQGIDLLGNTLLNTVFGVMMLLVSWFSLLPSILFPFTTIIHFFSFWGFTGFYLWIFQLTWILPKRQAVFCIDLQPQKKLVINMMCSSAFKIVQESQTCLTCASFTS